MQVPNSLTAATTTTAILLLHLTSANANPIFPPYDTQWRANEYSSTVCASPIMIAHNASIIQVSNLTRAIDTATPPNDPVALWQVFSDYSESDDGRPMCAGILMGEMPGGCWDLGKFESSGGDGGGDGEEGLRVGCLFPYHGSVTG
ncbi:Uu.00g101000.m01.CDS01 [Anthostomella pinea]|uniref:Uu.00g101000.m01.CDS01 n=1 Tax=Anthostomella pinea TaxID=933095 RepID=A0AAI8VE36_9PEZI|nr:Uu.00g101000.m01.CDS01 [Anthostomella pinea]